MSDRIKAFWLGIFILLAIGITAWLILFLKPSVGDGKLTLKVRFSNIDKVENGTRVTFAGKPVGEVSKIMEIADPRQAPSDEFGNLYIYELTLKVDSSVQVYSYDEIIFTTSGLLGEKSIAIIPKSAPPGAPPPQNVTHEALFARSTDKLTETLTQVTQVAEKIGNTMEGVNEFLSTNSYEFHKTLKSLSGAADEVQIFVSDATQRDFTNRAANAADALASTMKSADLLIKDIKEKQLVDRMGRSLDNIYTITNRVNSGEGTLGKLIHSDSFYLQITGMINKVDTLLNDINNYGLLFQYDKGWQRSRTARMNKMRQLCTPCDFYLYLDKEMSDISVSMNRVGQALQTIECREIPVNSECFAESFLELMARVESLQNSLKIYTEMLLGDYCHKCN